MARHGKTPTPRAHWLLLATLLAAVTGLLALHALLAGALGAEAVLPIGSTNHVPDAVRTGGPVIDPRRDPPVTLHPPDRTLALTFDDGPDPQWTPAILDALSRHGVHATFFVTGAQAAKHPGLIDEILARGNEIGHHTATHADLRTTGSLRTWLELRSTDLVLAFTAGTNTSLVRPPYAAEPDSVDDAAWAAAKRLGDSGRLVVLSSLDSEDWRRRPGVDTIVANATPPDDRGAVLLMHDAGGDRLQTVAALDKLLPTLKERGWRVGTVSATIGATGSSTPRACWTGSAARSSSAPSRPPTSSPAHWKSCSSWPQFWPHCGPCWCWPPPSCTCAEPAAPPDRRSARRSP